MSYSVVTPAQAHSLSPEEKWRRLAPFLQSYGSEALSYATLQTGLEYFITPDGYIAYTTVQHPVFAPAAKRIAFADPVCASERLPRLVEEFLALGRKAVFACITEATAAALRRLKFKINCIGCEVELPVQTYNTQGNWKELDLVKRGRNEARREGISIREVAIETVPSAELEALSRNWIGTKKVNDREIWIYARRPVFTAEEGVRKFVAFDRAGKVAGFVFYDPMYRAGKVMGYSANISRCDEKRFGRLATAIHMTAMDVFRPEGCEVLNLNLSPFVKLEAGRYNDDVGAKWFFRMSERFGNDIYNFRGLAFHKSKYRGTEKFLYFASNSLMPANDIYLAFRAADITRGYFATLGKLLRGMASAKNGVKTTTNGQ
jgi:lysylphosphatidylglycerol synthetase-like protein (DUF2156 family)